MSHDKKNTFILRDRVLALLSDEENAKVSQVEAEYVLSATQQYVDLNKLERGVLTAPADFTAMGHVLPRRALRESTWSSIVALIESPSAPEAGEPPRIEAT